MITSIFRLISLKVRKLRGADWLIVLAGFVFVLFGLAAIYSVDLSRGAELFNIKKQLFAIVAAGILAFFVATSNYKLLRNYSLILYIFGVVILVAVLFFGTTVRGARGWFVFDLVSVQPVEYMKLVLILSLASYFSQRARPLFGLRECLESALISFVPIVLTLLQPDFGSALILAGIWFCFTLFAGMRFRFIASLTGIFSVLFLFSWKFLFAAYQKARILTFFNPTFDPLGQGYNVSQAIIAIGAGGWFGRGLGFGSQSQLKFLPESQNDFIFAVIAEELGLLGVILVLGAFALLFLRFAFIIRTSRDNFSAFLVIGIASTFFLQILVNIGMNLGLFPVTGIGLPLVSYGGSSAALFLILLGIVQSIVIHEKRS
ncbi:rod shape-determining protein RodA [Candidatus Uhrbacteria bacterium]|nr:rod shape-determining protein RodA [Candidatus Uhrbacteria bacterium]